MRRLTNIVFVLGFFGVVAAIGVLRVEDHRHEQEIEQVAEAVRRFELVIKYHAATNEVELTGRGWPTTIDPAWFSADPPTNTLLSADRPWVEIATPEEADLLHPDNRIASDATVSMFWYNPYQGVIRTRVPPQISDQEALDLYNRLNRCELPSIFPTPPDESHPALPAITTTPTGAPAETPAETVDESMFPPSSG